MPRKRKASPLDRKLSEPHERSTLYEQDPMYGILPPHAGARENGNRNVTKKPLEYPQAVFTIGHSTKELAEMKSPATKRVNAL